MVPTRDRSELPQSRPPVLRAPLNRVYSVADGSFRRGTEAYCQIFYPRDIQRER